jgi:hypothetical protein
MEDKLQKLYNNLVEMRQDFDSEVDEAYEVSEGVSEGRYDYGYNINDAFDGGWEHGRITGKHSMLDHVIAELYLILNK